MSGRAVGNGTVTFMGSAVAASPDRVFAPLWLLFRPMEMAAERAGLDVLSPALAALAPALGVDQTADLVAFLADEVPVDGRAARSYRTRRAIVDALRALHAQGDLRPTASRLAERAGVSLRTVWQHFADVDALVIEAGRRDIEILLSILHPIDADQLLPARIALSSPNAARCWSG